MKKKLILAILVSIYIILTVIRHRNKDIKNKEENILDKIVKYKEMILIPIILIIALKLYRKMYSNKIKATMIYRSRKIDENVIGDNDIESLKQCTKVCLKDMVLAKDFSEYTGDNRLEEYFKEKLVI